MLGLQKVLELGWELAVTALLSGPGMFLSLSHLQAPFLSFSTKCGRCVDYVEGFAQTPLFAIIISSAGIRLRVT